MQAFANLHFRQECYFWLLSNSVVFKEVGSMLRYAEEMEIANSPHR